jgi:hypothetical protein
LPPIPSKRVISRWCRPAGSRAWTRRSRHDSARQPHLGSTLVENNAASHPLDEGVSAGQNYLYVLADGLS